MENNFGKTEQKKSKKFKFKAPDALALILILLIVASIATYILPTGEFTRYENPVTGIEMADPTSYHRVENNPVSLWGVLKAIPIGLNDSAEIMNFLLIIGGVFGILQGTGSLDALLGSLIKKLEGKERLMIPFILGFWALGGAILGNFEECLAFLPLQITLCLALGFDSILGVALGMCGVAVGYICAILNPFTVGLAQKIAEVPMFSGIGLRVGGFVFLLAVTTVYLYIYAGKIQKNPELSLSYETDLNSPYRENNLLDENVVFSTRHKITLLLFMLGIVFMVYGVINFDFFLPEIAAVFVAIGIICGISGGLGVNEAVEHFVQGATNLLYAALCVGLARAITVVMTEGNILDVIVFAFSKFVVMLPKQLTAIGMFFFQAVVNIFIDLFPNIKLQLKRLKYDLTFRIWDYKGTSQEKQIQYQSINQGFRMVGSINNKYDLPVIAFKTGEKVSLSYLNDYTIEDKNKVDINKPFRPTQYTLEEAKEKFPDWYQRVVIEGNKNANKWHIKRDLYDWWLRQKDKVVGGHRYFYLMCMVIYAVKCDIPKKEVKEDMKEIFDYLTKIEHNNQLTEDDLQAALEVYDRGYYNFTIEDIEKLTDIRINRNKRNYRNQKLHLRGARAIQEINDPESNWRNNDGRPSKEELVKEYIKNNSDDNPTEIARNLGISRTTVYKYLI